MNHEQLQTPGSAVVQNKNMGSTVGGIITGFIHHGLAPGISPSLRPQLDGTHRHILLVITKRTINYLSRVALSRGPAVVKAGQQSPKNK